MLRKLLRLTLLRPVVVVALSLIAAKPVLAQVPVATLEEMGRQLSPGDVISVVRTNGESITGRLLRFGDDDLSIRAVVDMTPQLRRKTEVTAQFSDIYSIERKRDAPRKATLIGAGVGAGFALTMFGVAYAKDRNEVDEWGASYLLLGGFTTGVGALVGRVIDLGHSRPHIKFVASPEARLKIRAAPLLSANRRGLVLSLTF